MYIETVSLNSILHLSDDKKLFQIGDIVTSPFKGTGILICVQYHIDNCATSIGKVIWFDQYDIFGHIKTEMIKSTSRFLKTKWITNV